MVILILLSGLLCEFFGYCLIIFQLSRCHCCLRMTDGMKLEPSCLLKWMLVWEEEWQRSLYLELTILQQVDIR